MQVGQTYVIQTDVVDLDDPTAKAKMKYVPAELLKEYEHFYLFKTKNYKTTIHKQDYRRKPKLIQEV